VLVSRRDRLYALLDRHWLKTRSTVKKLKKLEDVPALLRPISEGEDAVKIFVTKIESRFASSDMDNLKLVAQEARTRISELKGVIASVTDARDMRRSRLDRITTVLNLQMTDAQRTRAVLEQNNLRRDVNIDESELRELRHELASKSALLARAAVVQFVTANPSRVNPLKMANALAGVPEIGWRQSVNRCRQFPAPSGASTFGMYATMLRIIDSKKKTAMLCDHVEQWLRKTPPSKCAEVPFLRKKWYYLKPAILTVTDSRNGRRDQLAQAVVEGFLRMCSDASPVDKLFEEEEQITRKRRKIK
jgi:hypothetical protein